MLFLEGKSEIMKINRVRKYQTIPEQVKERVVYDYNKRPFMGYVEIARLNNISRKSVWNIIKEYELKETYQEDGLNKDSGSIEKSIQQS